MPFDHTKLRAKYFEPELGFCQCEHCVKLPMWITNKQTQERSSDASRRQTEPQPNDQGINRESGRSNPEH